MMTGSVLALLGLAVLATVVYALGVRAIALLYPRDDPRREEIIAERYAVPRKERLFWIFEQFETAWIDGRDARAEARSRARKEAKASAPDEESQRDKPVTGHGEEALLPTPDADGSEDLENEVRPLSHSRTYEDIVQSRERLGRPHDVSQTDALFRTTTAKNSAEEKKRQRFLAHAAQILVGDKVDVSDNVGRATIVGHVQSGKTLGYVRARRDSGNGSAKPDAEPS
ncbi:hypothetical protein [Haloechinothrix salitolerans]|uniref:Uncharacterized protein n=1 Tax=Haloechinothrix salitolerans TaxID=926830 RepID=A0ABW2BVJ2_9PSEU